MRGSAPRRVAVVFALSALMILVASPPAALGLSFDRATYPTGITAFSVAAADFNGDSDPDLAVVNLDSDTVSILVGAPGGTFTGPTNLAAGGRPIGVATGDFNGDSDPDLAVGNNSTRTVSILLGGPGATFTGPTPFTTAGGSEHVAIGEFNGDSDPDLAVANRFNDNVSVLLGEAGGGTFSPRVNYSAGTDPLGVAVADFNGDLDPDIVVTDYSGPPNVTVLEGQAGGAFGNASQVSAGQNPVGVAVAEFNGDSDPDLAITNFQGGNVSVLLGTAGSGFTAPTNYFTHAGPHAVAVGDLNGDTDLDLAVANASGSNMSILLGAAGSTFVDHGDFPLGSGPRSVLTRDFNQDGKLDLALATDAGLVTLLAVDSPSFSIDDVAQAEGNSGETDFTFTVRTSGPTSDATAVTYRTVDGTATAAGSDYTTVPPQTLTFTPQETAKTVTVKVPGDIALENDEDFGVVLSDPVNAVIADGTGVGTITDDDHVGYPRPKGASPLRTSLVPAYTACASPNRTHGTPLAFASCNPPQHQSSQLTTGTADANGAQANSVGFVRLSAIVGTPSNPEDEADIRITMSITDVRHRSDLADYTGEVKLFLPTRLTDRVGSGGGDEPQTVTDALLRAPASCAATASSSIGSTCSLTTTMDSISPGAVQEGKRSIWALDQVRVDDGGADGDAGTEGDNTPFARQGIFIP
jgi:uncharacterized protein